MKLLHPARLGRMFGLAVALGATGAHAQNVITRQIDSEPVETTVTQTPAGTVITRRPLAPTPIAPATDTLTVAPAPAYDIDAVRVRPYATAPYPAYPTVTATTTRVDETTGAAPARRPAPRAATRVIHHPGTDIHRDVHRSVGAPAVTRTVHHTTRRLAAAPLVLNPSQRQVVYRTIVQQQVIPPAGYPPFPPPAYPRAVVIPPAATTGYAVTTPAGDIDEVDDVYAEQVPPAIAPARYVVGAQLPAAMVPVPLPAAAVVQVPSVRPYSYVTVDNRVLLVDPVTHTVVADITP